MNTIPEIVRRFKGRWGAECFWSAAAGIIALSPVVIYSGYIFALRIAESAKAGNAGMAALRLIIAASFMFLVPAVGGFTGWLAGFFVRKAASLGKRWGDLFYGSVLYGMIISLPFGAFLGFYMAEEMVGMASCLMDGAIPEGEIRLFFDSLYQTLLALAAPSLLGGAVCGLAGWIVTSAILCLKSVFRNISFRYSATK
jgi:hypothetical protein